MPDIHPAHRMWVEEAFLVLWFIAFVSSDAHPFAHVVAGIMVGAYLFSVIKAGCAYMRCLRG